MDQARSLARAIREDARCTQTLRHNPRVERQLRDAEANELDSAATRSGFAIWPGSCYSFIIGWWLLGSCGRRFAMLTHMERAPASGAELRHFRTTAI